MARAKNAELTMEEIADRLDSIEERLEELETIAKEQDDSTIEKISQIESRVESIIATLRQG